MSASSSEHDHSPARADLHDATGWIALGVAILVGSLTMDRLQSQNINPYTVPGLLPGLLGAAMILLGSVLALRSWRRGALHEARVPATPEQRAQRVRIAVILVLCIGYAAGLVGHGLPFWVASALFVATTILVLQRMNPDPQERVLTAKTWAQAIVVGLCAAIAIQLVFQELFLVRLP
ncbi:tripartite tricarboxylate transporter TctB family protein [Ramlibacter sp. G-1-2-2]|uniref:Tripartite tricarboxylate transporter TctB family protein n=1 Tax=Ramlibacter agri TaxID=2728837 RepID=A0A848HB07_9BURK|nr:tripartite tricarboxylate transporter TctB family protein [Ramlibacter agri]NML46660.1 tripartite tricarboxylate transporter TctB family protein [Ramlibacter agri]